MPGRRWSDGLHQAVEAKEAVKIERENQTLATITFQNYFRMYKKLSGMTGTAETEAPVDGILQEDNTKANGVRQLHATGQPILIGSISIEKSEAIAEHLKRAGI